MAQDWAGLSHFKEANALLAPPVEGEKRVVFMGNSITIGWLSHYPEFFRGKPYVNRGIGGQTTSQMLIRFRQDVISLQPAVVVILAGTNDIAQNNGPISLEDIMANIISMSEMAETNGIKVVLASVLPAADYSWRPGLEPNRKIPKLNSMIKAYSERKGFVYLDYFAAMNDGNNGLRKELGEDGVHPNKAGYKIMAPLTEQAIKEALIKE
ncbi:SGNH/GDSL hydrolase family protein [Lentiprolixibacter aurantiacus]|uniref:SGNH/GDSL hydrolase family protein n=1 Tax=Lentiprolixibacter aurantiacus TaxID=2993939 RepID=A0AAE3SNG1_9FLAO|nr:SGNH/GDSL hydrolase family protein [Lentiprolixibacter aurantiacus]MCX2719490.1 SGNH/GDSL hydrolase family protein [Lentiprolixibacter aurantiacus]